MFELLKNLFRGQPEKDWATLVKEGAVIVDVRSRAEYAAGHIRNSINIPLQDLTKHLSKLKKDKPLITCCASGRRSRMAKNILLANGYAKVENGGGWMHLDRYLHG
jgi:phage shock protein E